jgi:hypothetical protein
MSDNSENRRRALAEVVTLDAWHDEFNDQASKVDLHVDVVFESGRIGGEPESPVRFRLNIRQADVVVVVPESEPVAVDKRSVSRDSPPYHGQMTETFERAARGSVKGSAVASASTTGISASATTEIGGEASVASSKKLEITATLQLMLVTQAMTPDGHYRWSLRPSDGSVLRGRPWDAKQAPRLKIIDQRKHRKKGIPPTVRVEVRCKREDLDISEVVLKDETLFEATRRRVGFRNRQAAAEAYIRDRLAKEGLAIRNFADSFGELTLASILAGPQPPDIEA